MDLYDFHDRLAERLTDRKPSKVVLLTEGPPAPGERPGEMYLYWATDAGALIADRLADRGGQHEATWSAWVVCVGITPDSARRVVKYARDALLGYEIDTSLTSTSLVEVPTGAVMLSEGPEGDRRHSFTLTYRCHTTRS